MKFSDLDENLVTEAPHGLGKRIAAKAQSKIAPGKEQRRRGATKDRVYSLAKQIKNDWKNWLTASYDNPKHEASMEDFLLFMQNNTGLGEVAEEMAKKKYPNSFASTSDPETEVGSDEVDGNDLEPEKDKEPDARGDQSEEEVRAAYKQQGDELEAERKARGDDPKDGDVEEEVEEDADDAEPKVDMSASIYESRLRLKLFELRDNQIDTLIVMTLQQAAKMGDGNLDNIGGKYSGEPVTQEPEDEPKKDGILKKAGKMYRKGMDKASAVAFGDAEKANPLSNVGDDESGGTISGANDPVDLDNSERREFAKALDTILAGKGLSKDQLRVIKQIRKQL